MGKSIINEKLVLKSWEEYAVLVANAYENAKDFDSTVVGQWASLNKSNYTLFKRLLSKVNVVFTTNNQSDVGTTNILGRDFKIEYINPDDEYKTQSEMKSSFESTGILKISIDHSSHPIFSVKDNIVFRTVHDYIVHILGNHDFGAKGEIASYNRHAKLAPKDAIPALFIEVVGQACSTIVNGGFPKQKIANLKGFDYYNVGQIDDENYIIVDKTLVDKRDADRFIDKPKEPKAPRVEPTAIQAPVKKQEPVLEPEMEENIKLIKKLLEVNKIKGGKGDKLKPEDVDQEELAVGKKVEKEHVGNDMEAAEEITLDHLAEKPDYYKKAIKSKLVDEKPALDLAKKFKWEVPEISETKKLIKKLLKEAMGYSVIDETPETTTFEVLYNGRKAGTITIGNAEPDLGELTKEIMGISIEPNYMSLKTFVDTINGLWGILPDVQRFVVRLSYFDKFMWEKAGATKLNDVYYMLDRNA